MKYLICALVLISGCAMFENAPDCIDRGDGFCWYVHPVQIPVNKVVWEVDTADNASKRCNYGKPYKNASCVLWRDRQEGVCHVVSALTELQAMKISTLTPMVYYQNRGTSIYWHEVKDHCGISPGGALGLQWQHRDELVYHITELR